MNLKYYLNELFEQGNKIMTNMDHKNQLKKKFIRKEMECILAAMLSTTENK